MIDRLALPPRHRRMVEALLREHVPEAEVWAYGSRVNGESHDGSDLDLVVRSPSLEPMGAEFLDLVGAFQESNIPILVQAHDWAGLPKSFHQEIERDYVVVQEGTKHKAAGEWYEIPFSEAVLLNPAVRITRGEAYPFVDMASVSGESRSVYPSEHREFRGGGSRFQDGDTLMARITPCLENGKIARYHAPDSNDLAHGSTEFIVIRGRPNVTDNEFAYYLCRCEEVRDYAISQMTGTSGRQRVPTESLNHLMVSLPPLPEQRDIAHVLGTLDDKIELSRRMNETLEAMARAIFQDWFVDFGPTRAKMEGREPYLPPDVWSLFPDRLVDSELGLIPEGWEVRGLGEVVELLRDQENPLSSPETVFSHFSIPAFDDGRMPKQEQGESIKSAKSRVPPGVILLSKLNPDIERVWLTDVESGERAVCSTEFLVLRPRQPFGTCFVYCLGRSPAFRQQLGSLVTGTSKSHQRAPAEAVLALPTILPSKPVTHKFERFTQAILGKTQMNQRESHTLVAQRDALLPRLVSGEVGV